ncbi:MAG: RtcB family protein [Planctomycetota bacterium]
MNIKQLSDLGIPKELAPNAIAAIQHLRRTYRIRKPELRQRLSDIADNPSAFLDDPDFGELAAALKEAFEFELPPPAPFDVWGDEVVDENSKTQMHQACSVPCAVRGALMPDAHLGYGLPIGGVLACDNAVIPYAVGVDIACRMKLSVLDVSPDQLDINPDAFRDALQDGTRFGVGARHETKQQHDVMDRDWAITKTTRQLKDKAWTQLGTSGSGNHFVEFGTVEIPSLIPELGLQPGTYVGLLSHSGSRGAGAAVCNTYSGIARARLPQRFQQFSRLAWLSLEEEAGQEYWNAMQLMGQYAAANHDVIHRLVTAMAGCQVLHVVENHHNFAWIEQHDGRDVVVHRKGATPADAGVLGVIPGSMQAPAHIVRGLGNAASLTSASHGAGRQLSRKKARDKYRINAVKNDLEKKGIDVLSAGSDEVPGAYKDIEQVMSFQQDLVQSIGTFQPRIVKMCDGD